jgi:hypothetical protein
MTYLQVSLFFFSAEDEIKPSERCCQGLAAKLPLRLVFFFSLLFPHNDTRIQERNSLYLLCFFFYSASLVFFLSFLLLFFSAPFSLVFFLLFMLFFFLGH